MVELDHFTPDLTVFLPITSELDHFFEGKRKTREALFYKGSRVTGAEGIEPPPKVLETPIIPLDQAPLA